MYKNLFNPSDNVHCLKDINVPLDLLLSVVYFGHSTRGQQSNIPVAYVWISVSVLMLKE